MANYNRNATANRSQPNRARQLHEQLLSDLILKFIQTKAEILQWRHQFKVHSIDSNVVKGSISGHFEFLEERGMLQIGNYDILKKMFDSYNKTVGPFIDERSQEIEEALENNQNEDWEESHEGMF